MVLDQSNGYVKVKAECEKQQIHTGNFYVLYVRPRGRERERGCNASVHGQYV